MTPRLVEVSVNASRTALRMLIRRADGALVRDTVKVVDHGGIVAFEGLAELMDQMSDHSLDVVVALNRLCSLIYDGGMPVLPVELERPEFAG